MLFGCAAKPRGEKLFRFSPSYNHYQTRLTASSLRIIHPPLSFANRNLLVAPPLLLLRALVHPAGMLPRSAQPKGNL